MNYNLLKIFVYGTLKPGERNYQRYCVGKVVEQQRAIANGQLFALPLGYPAMTLGDNLVYGFLLTFADQLILETLDNLEGYEPSRPQSENHYNRSLIEIYTINERSQCTAYAYLMELKQVNFLNGVFLASGNWNE